MSTSSLSSLSLDLDIAILRIEGMLIRRQGGRRRRESSNIVTMLLYIRGILIEVRRMVGNGGGIKVEV